MAPLYSLQAHEEITVFQLLGEEDPEGETPEDTLDRMQQLMQAVRARKEKERAAGDGG